MLETTRQTEDWGVPCRARVSFGLVYACACLFWLDLVSGNGSVVGCKGKGEQWRRNFGRWPGERYLGMMFLPIAKAWEGRSVVQILVAKETTGS